MNQSKWMRLNKKPLPVRGGANRGVVICNYGLVITRKNICGLFRVDVK